MNHPAKFPNSTTSGVRESSAQAPKKAPRQSPVSEPLVRLLLSSKSQRTQAHPLRIGISAPIYVYFAYSLGANVYLSALDHFVQRELKPQIYLRYLDDLLLVDRDSNKILDEGDTINRWPADNRAQRLNKNKSHFTNLYDSITYLGYQLRQTDSSKEPLQILPEPIIKMAAHIALTRLHHHCSQLQTRQNGQHNFAAWNFGTLQKLSDAQKSVRKIY